MQIDKARHLKTWEEITKGVILLPSPKTSYMKANMQNDEETCIYAQKNTLGRPKHDPRFRSMAMHPKCKKITLGLLKCELGTPSATKIHLGT